MSNGTIYCSMCRHWRTDRWRVEGECAEVMQSGRVKASGTVRTDADFGCVMAKRKGPNKPLPERMLNLDRFLGEELDEAV